jgi:hypothetical protein
MENVKDILVSKITTSGTFLSIIVGEITQETNIKLSAISYIVAITLGIVTIIIKIWDFLRTLKK